MTLLRLAARITARAAPYFEENLGKPALLLALLPVVAFLHLPSLRLGWFGDDFAHRRFIFDHLHGRGETAWWNMFDGRLAVGVQDADPATLFGRLPWWASADFSFALLRPLSTASHFLDYLLWADRPWLMHLHNSVLFVGIIVLAAALYSRLLGRGFPLVAAVVMLALDDANTTSTAWIASRNTLLTALFVLATLFCYERGVRTSGHWLRAAPLTLACAHASSEGGIVSWAYLLAYSICLDPRLPGARLRTLVPLAAVSLVWIALSRAMGYGVTGSGVYIDPREDPLAFAMAATQRLPRLLELQLAMPPEFTGATQGGAAVTAGVSYVYLALFAVAAVWAARRSRSVRFFGIATVLSLLPQCAAGSFARLLLLSTFAAHGLTASLFGALLRAGGTPIRVLVLAPFCCALLFFHGWVALALPARSLQFTRAIHESVLQGARTLPRGASLSRATIIVLNYPDYLRSVFISLYRRALFTPGPERMHVLGIASAPVKLTRTEPNALQLEPVGGYLLDPATLLVRRSDDRFVRGQHFDLTEVQVEVNDITSDGRPSRVVVRTAPQHEQLLWVSWNEPRQSFEAVALPTAGNSIWLDPWRRTSAAP